MPARKTTGKSTTKRTTKKAEPKAEPIRYVPTSNGLILDGKLIEGSVTEAELIKGKADINYLIASGAIIEEAEWLTQMRNG